MEHGALASIFALVRDLIIHQIPFLRKVGKSKIHPKFNLKLASFSFSLFLGKDCPKLSKILHGDLIVTKKAVAKPICDTNFTLIGSPLIYCNDERQWNDTLPQCMGKIFVILKMRF
jgi:hypothetical protein